MKITPKEICQIFEEFERYDKSPSKDKLYEIFIKEAGANKSVYLLSEYLKYKTHK